MSAFTIFKNSALWRPFSRLYQMSGLKARVYSRRCVPPVKTISEEKAFALFGLTPAPWVNAPEFLPPVSAASGPMPPEDADFFARFVSAFSPRSAFEFGTNWGVSTAVLALNTAPNARIWTLDVCREMFSDEHLRADPELQMILRREHTGWFCTRQPSLTSKVTQIFADSLTFDLASHEAGQRSYDLILVDACHKYEFVKRDTENALKRLAQGGCIVWHDFYPDVSSWAEVFRYVSEFALAHGEVHHVMGTHIAIWKNHAAASSLPSVPS